MAEVIWSPEAIQDVSGIGNTIGRTSESYASSVVSKIFRVVDSLQTLPESGSEVEEYLNPEIRERLSGKYRIIYRLRENVVEVLTVIHGSRRLPILLG